MNEDATKRIRLSNPKKKIPTLILRMVEQKDDNMVMESDVIRMISRMKFRDLSSKSINLTATPKTT